MLSTIYVKEPAWIFAACFSELVTKPPSSADVITSLPNKYYKINSFETAQELPVSSSVKIKFLLTLFLQWFLFRTHKGIFLVPACLKGSTDVFSVLFPALGLAQSNKEARGERNTLNRV